MTSRLTIERQVDRYIFLYGAIMTIGLLTFLVQYKLDMGSFFSGWEDYLSRERIFHFVLDKWEILTLSLCALYLYLAVTFDMKKTREFGPRLFSEDRRPTTWARVRSRGGIALYNAMTISAFLGLAWFVDNTAIFSLVLVWFFVAAIIGVFNARENMHAYFSDAALNTAGTAVHRFVMQRRAAVEEYVNRPHILRESLMAGTSLIAFVLALSTQTGLLPYKGIAEVVLVGALICNELVVWSWRLRRNRLLQVADDAQDDENARQEERSPRRPD